MPLSAAGSEAEVQLNCRRRPLCGQYVAHAHKTPLFMESFMFHWVMQEIGWNRFDGTTILKLLLILIKSFQPLTNLASFVRQTSLDRTALSEESCT